MPEALDHVRCPECGRRLVVLNHYTPVKNDDDPRPWDPDWVFQDHLRRAHRGT